MALPLYCHSTCEKGNVTTSGATLFTVIVSFQINLVPLPRRQLKRYESSSSDSPDDEYGQASEECSSGVLIYRPRPLHQYDNLQVFHQPMCLIFSDENNIPRFEKSVVDELAMIDMPLVVAGIAGLYRTGKSYLLNLIAEENS
ncbi:uncharacterized protein LOC128204538 [Mya arenaria]|uniref:uncharacterized protein LOC128204538 n=1 Tax=Mya arenaria TaxID=6604 RepID=UPI0022E3BEEC|nr:uncharacterized protein LOC128204538 [Mya arenaria]